MVENITYEEVEAVWSEFVSLPDQRMRELVGEMSREQPIVLAFLLEWSEQPYGEENELELLMTGAVALWLILRSGRRETERVRRSHLVQAKQANDATIEVMSGDTPADLESAVLHMWERYPEPEVLRFLIEMTLQDADDASETSQANSSAFFHLKTLLDAFLAARDDGSMQGL